MCPSAKGRKSVVLDLVNLKVQKHQFARYMKMKYVDFPESLLQQFNFK